MSKLKEMQEAMLALSPGETIAVTQRDLAAAVVDYWEEIDVKRGTDEFDAAIGLADWILSIGIRRMPQSYSDVVWFIKGEPTPDD